MLVNPVVLASKRCRESRKYIPNRQQPPVNSVKVLLKASPFIRAAKLHCRLVVNPLKLRCEMSESEKNNRYYIVWFIVAVLIALIPWIVLS